MHESGEWIESTITVPMSKNDAQGYGSAITYARRYSLAAITGLPQEDDDGNEASKQSKPKQETVSAPKLDFIALSDEMKAEVKKVAAQVASEMRKTAESEPNPKKAIEIMEMFCESYPEDETLKPAIWSQLHSTIRKAIKEYQSKATVKNGDQSNEQ